MRKTIYGILFLYTTIPIFAQEVLWQKDIKSSTQDFLNQVTTTIDGQYLITGSSIQSRGNSTATSKQNNGYDFHLVKLDQQGNELWEKYFSGQNHDYLSGTVATQDGGFLVSGTTFSGMGQDKKEDSKGSADMWLIRLNEFGDEIWQKTLGTSLDEEARAVIQTTDMGFFIAGNIQNSAKRGSKDIWIVRLDKNGKIISENILSGDGLDEAEKLVPTMDGGALLGVYSRSGITKYKTGAPAPSSESAYVKKTENYGEGDYWVVKLSKEGKVEWEKNFGGKGDDHLRTLSLTSNGYLIGGESRSSISGNKTVEIKEGTDLWLISLNNKGEELWQKSYNFGNRDVLMGTSVLHSADDKSTKGILLGGYTQAEGPSTSSGTSHSTTDDEKFWMLYLDKDGNEQWRKHVKGESARKQERLSDITLNRDGTILLAGTSADDLGKENWKIVKLGDKQINELIEKQEIKIYPNPVSDYAYVEIGFDFEESDIILYDMGGRQIQNLKTKNKVTKINTQNLIHGAYLVTIKTNTNKTASAKLIKK